MKRLDLHRQPQRADALPGDSVFRLNAPFSARGELRLDGERMARARARRQHCAELRALRSELRRADTARPNAAKTSHPMQRSLMAAVLATVLVPMSIGPAMAQQIDPFNPLPRDPNAPGLTRGNSNLADPGRTDSLLSFGAAAAVKRIDITTEKLEIPADSRSLVRFKVRLLDADDKPLQLDVPVLLETTRGRIVAPGQGNTALEAAIDRDRTTQGIQAVAKGGEFSFDLVAPGEPGEAQVRVSAGQRQMIQKITFVPDLREMIAVGLVEGLIVLRDGKNGLLPVRPSDGFDQEIRRWQRDFSNGDGAVGLRTAFFLKGKISGQTLLTAAYDSDKDVRGRMFRDISPDEFYPVYGDASIKGYDAQTSGRFFVRVDNGKSYALYGDFNTVDTVNDALLFSRYNRSLTGAKANWDGAAGNLTVFASKDNLRQVVDEIAGKGISGPYTARFPNGVQNTEKVELLVRDRNAPAVILRITPQVRFVDYDFEPFSGRILFKSPIPSLDENLNPVSIRISYEVEEGGPKYWVGGFEGNLKVGKDSRIGATYAKDENPLAKFELAGLNTSLRLDETTTLVAEYARSKRGDIIDFGSNSLASINSQIGAGNTQTAGAATGEAWRIEARHASATTEARVYAQRTDTGFTNIGSSVAAGREELGSKLSYTLTPGVRLIGEAISSRELTTDGKRMGASGAVAWDISQQLTLEVGVRHAEQSGAGAAVPPTVFPSTGVDPIAGGQTLVPNAGLSANQNQPYTTTSARARLTYRPTMASSLFLEGEQDVNDSSAHAVAVGGDYRFSEVGRIYGRSEWATGVSGSYGLAGEGKQSSTVVGVDAQYMKDGQVFSEYRLRDAFAGREAVAAVGLRNGFPIGEGLRLNTTLERVKAVNGPTTPEAKAAGIGLDYTGSKVWKGSTRLEWRDDNQSTSWLNTNAVARKLSDDWTLLARTYAYRQSFDSGNRNNQDRAQIGFAWRETDTNRWNALGKYEYRRELVRTIGLDDLNGRAHVVSLDVDYHPARPVWYAGKVAAKWRKDVLAGVPDSFDAQLLQGRVIYDITPRWDIGFIASVLGENGFKTRRAGVGVELGRIVSGNLWVSAGYNQRDLKDRDLMTDYSSKGIFLRLRWKFDEGLFKSDDPAFNRSLAQAESGAAAQAPAR
ncbi:hypothetical protein IP84_03585 [beta proteobacterium AAP99]|nr:hypothetical protein IP84_03585 [beta proteobacterium AAP99]